MNWESEYTQSSRPWSTGLKNVSGNRDLYEYGIIDEEDGVSFAEALQKPQAIGGLALRLVEGAEISAKSISFAQLQDKELLNYRVPLQATQHDLPLVYVAATS